MDYPKFIVSNQKEESISIERVKHACAAIWEPEPLDFRKLSFPSHLGKYYIKIGKISAKIHDTLYLKNKGHFGIGNDSHLRP